MPNCYLIIVNRLMKIPRINYLAIPSMPNNIRHFALFSFLNTQKNILQILQSLFPRRRFSLPFKKTKSSQAKPSYIR